MAAHLLAEAPHLALAQLLALVELLDPLVQLLGEDLVLHACLLAGRPAPRRPLSLEGRKRGAAWPGRRRAPARRKEGGGAAAAAAGDSIRAGGGRGRAGEGQANGRSAAQRLSEGARARGPGPSGCLSPGPPRRSLRHPVMAAAAALRNSARTSQAASRRFREGRLQRRPLGGGRRAPRPALRSALTDGLARPCVRERAEGSLMRAVTALWTL